MDSDEGGYMNLETKQAGQEGGFQEKQTPFVVQKDKSSQVSSLRATSKSPPRIWVWAGKRQVNK